MNVFRFIKVLVSPSNIRELKEAFFPILFLSLIIISFGWLVIGDIKQAKEFNAKTAALNWAKELDVTVDNVSCYDINSCDVKSGQTIHKLDCNYRRNKCKLAPRNN